MRQLEKREGTWEMDSTMGEGKTAYGSTNCYLTLINGFRQIPPSVLWLP